MSEIETTIINWAMNQSFEEQEDDELLEFDWEVKSDGLVYSITIQVSNSKKVTRVGGSFGQACSQFGVVAISPLTKTDRSPCRSY